MSKDESVDDNDPRLFFEAVGKVQPVHDDRAPLRSAPPPPKPRQKALDAEAALQALAQHPFAVTDVQPGDEVSYARQGLKRGVLKKLRRGEYRLDGELDLHGLSAWQAEQALALFFSEALAEGLRCLRVIHGKGLRSKAAGPVLKSLTTGWLLRRDDVVAFCSAPPAMGGTGAVLVLLKGK